jgi:hypothetical protein
MLEKHSPEKMLERLMRGADILTKAKSGNKPTILELKDSEKRNSKNE